MKNGLKHVLERKGWIKDEPDVNQQYSVVESKVLELETDRNGRFFSKEAVESALKSLNYKPIPVTIGYPEFNCPEFGDRAGEATLEIKDNALYAELKIDKMTDDGRNIFNLLNDGCLHPVPTGCYEKIRQHADGLVDADYSIAGIALVSRQE
jgi:hypothetical protein